MHRFKHTSTLKSQKPTKHDFTYLIVNKPYGLLSKYNKSDREEKSLKDIVGNISTDIYPIGRLDKDSEGLLIMTNDKYLHTHLLHPQNKHPRSYWVQLDNTITENAITSLSIGGIVIQHNKKSHLTAPCHAHKIDSPEVLWDRTPPIRYRAHIPTSWIDITLTEGKNRQIRQMCAKVGFPVLRLIRHRIVGIHVHHLAGKPFITIDKKTLYPLLGL